MLQEQATITQHLKVWTIFHSKCNLTIPSLLYAEKKFDLT